MLSLRDVRRIAILGVSGSVGRQALDVVVMHPDRLRLVAVATHLNADALYAAAERFAVPTLICTAKEIERDGCVCLTGADAMTTYAKEGDYDVLLVAVTGLAGLAPTVAALARGKVVALANKETLVCGGEMVMRAIREGGGVLLPVDSEHAAIHQCLTEGATGLILTASGGALRDVPIADLEKATPDMVLAHPNWRMGPKITVDCATMVNKGLEVVEAHYLFDMPVERIEVLVHRESIVHSMVRYADGSVLAQMAVPDMRLPIQYALLYPARLLSPTPNLDLVGQRLTFDAVDHRRYPAFGLVLDAYARGQAALIALNAADEVAVQAFLEGHIPYGRLHTLLQQAISYRGALRDIADVVAVDAEVRRATKERI